MPPAAVEIGMNRIWIGLGLALSLAACGTGERERTTGGAAAGAVAGAGIGALGGPVGALAGAAIGGGVGAVTGATTSPRDVNLGRPPWSNPETRTPLDSNRRAERNRRAAHARAPGTTAEHDRAYMGGGMVGPGVATDQPVPVAPAATGPTPR